jgi:signal transduction histidine kinase
VDLVASSEAARLEALRRYRADDMPAEHELSALVRVAAALAGVPTATLNLLDDVVQRNYATFGFEGGSCARDDSLCAVALRERSGLHVPDASQDSRFAASPWVDGRLDSIRLYASAPLMTEDGWMIGTLCVFNSEPRHLPPHVLTALDDLAGLAMALLERRRLARRAEEALQAKLGYLAQLSHEIRTPMHAVLGLLDLVLEEELPARAQASAELARRSGRSLVSLVDDVLDLARGEAGRLQLHERPFDPAAVVRDVGEALRVLAHRKGLELVVHVDPAVPACVIGDPDRVRQVLVNLVGNAVKFSASGQVQLVLHADPCGSGEALLVMTVRDTGEGILATELPGLFRPFAQGRSGQRHGGTGLGLSICAQLAEQMGGRLGVSSTLGAGSTFSFHVRLPLGVPPQPADASGRGAPACASWSPMTAMSTGWSPSLCWSRSARRRQPSTTAPPPSSRSPPVLTTSSCSTTRCPAWTAPPLPGPSAPSGARPGARPSSP